MKNKLKIYTIVVFLCSTALLFAQSGPGSTSDDLAPDGLEANDNQMPIGDYLWVLAVVILVYAFFKVRAIHQLRN